MQLTRCTVLGSLVKSIGTTKCKKEILLAEKELSFFVLQFYGETFVLQICSIRVFSEL